MELIGILDKARAANSLVNLREIHKALKVKSHFRDWIKRRIRSNQYQVNIHFETLSSESLTADAGRPKVDYFVTDTIAKELVILETGYVAREFRDYLIQAEERLRKTPKLTPTQMFFQHAMEMVEEEERMKSQ